MNKQHTAKDQNEGGGSQHETELPVQQLQIRKKIQEETRYTIAVRRGYTIWNTHGTACAKTGANALEAMLDIDTRMVTGTSEMRPRGHRYRHWQKKNKENQQTHSKA